MSEISVKEICEFVDRQHTLNYGVAKAKFEGMPMKSRKCMKDSLACYHYDELEIFEKCPVRRDALGVK